MPLTQLNSTAHRSLASIGAELDFSVIALPKIWCGSK